MEPSQPPSLPSGLVLESAPAAAEVVVIGGGIVGCASAFFLARAGFRPLLVERAPALASATTAASAHAIRAQFAEPENVAMMRESLDVYERFAEVVDLPPEDAEIGLRQQGYLFASTKPDAAMSFRERIARQRTLGLDDVELLDGDEVRRRFPWIAFEVTAASFRARDGWLDACRAAVAFVRAAQVPGLLDATVLAIESTGSKVAGVVTTKGRIASPNVVVAAGPFSGQVAGLAGATLPITLIRRNRIVVAPDDRIPAHAPMTIDADTGAHWRPHLGGALAAWGRPEPPAPPAWPVPPDPTFPDSVLRDPDGIARLSPFWADLAREPPPSAVSLVAGQYTMTPDHMPLIGPAPGIAGLWLHTGYSGHGVMGSPSGARLLADVMSGKVATSDNPFRPGRFDEPGYVHGEAMVL